MAQGRPLDLLIVSGYTQLNPWNYSVRLGHRYGVKVYPSLDESRVRDEAARTLRSSPAAYRGRALNVWASRPDGVYIFNFFDPHSPLWRELRRSRMLLPARPSLFRQRPRRRLDARAAQKFIRVPTLNPASPIGITSGKPRPVEFGFERILRVWTRAGRATLRLEFKILRPAFKPRIELNGKRLPNGRIAGDWLDFNCR